MKEAEMLAMLASVLADAKALKSRGKSGDVKKIAQDAAANAEERARSAKVLARLEADMQAERDRFVPVAMQGQRGKGLRARSLESREENLAFREHVRNGGVKRGEDGKHETVRYSARDAAALEHQRDRDSMGERVLDDEALIRRVDSLSVKGRAKTDLSGAACDPNRPVRGCYCDNCRED